MLVPRILGGGFMVIRTRHGKVTTIDVDAIVDRAKSLNEGAIDAPNYGVDTWYWRVLAHSVLYPADQPISSFTELSFSMYVSLAAM